MVGCSVSDALTHSAPHAKTPIRFARRGPYHNFRYRGSARFVRAVNNGGA
jgi:hypothetical protein